MCDQQEVVNSSSQAMQVKMNTKHNLKLGKAAEHLETNEELKKRDDPYNICQQIDLISTDTYHDFFSPQIFMENACFFKMHSI